MSENSATRPNSGDDPSPFDELINAVGEPSAEVSFTTAFRGYDKGEVDAALSRLAALRRDEVELVAQLTERQRRIGAQNAKGKQSIARLESELKAVKAEADDAVERLEAELTAAQARATDAEQRMRDLGEELADSAEGSPSRHKFEEVLRVAEEQASVLVRNAADQGERLLVVAREEIANRRKEAQAESEAIIARAQHDAQQAHLRIETELTAHEARIAREAAHAAEKVVQADREAAAIRTEAEKGAAALRSMVARETEQARAEAEEAVRELRMRALEFEASLTRRQDDAQQEFLMLHNQAVAHAERITQDANEQVAASVEHAQRVSAKAEDFERLMRAQAHQIEADATLRANEQLDRARAKAQRIMDTVSTHSQSVLRDAEDRARQLRWQQHQLTSFMAEVSDLMRAETAYAASDAVDADAALAADAELEADDDEVLSAEEELAADEELAAEAELEADDEAEADAEAEAAADEEAEADDEADSEGEPTEDSAPADAALAER